MTARRASPARGTAGWRAGRDGGRAAVGLRWCRWRCAAGPPAAAVPLPAAGCPPERSRAASSSGSGRRPTSSSSAASSQSRRGEYEGSGQCRQPEGLPHQGAGRIRLGPATAPMVTAHTTIGQGPAAVFGVGEVDGGEARLQVGGRAEPQQGRGQQQHREDCPYTVDSDHQHGAGHGGEQARDQGDPAAAASGESRRGAARPAAAPSVMMVVTEPAQALRAGELDGQQGADGQAARRCRCR